METANRNEQLPDRSRLRRRRVLTDDQLADFRRDGFLVVQDLIDSEVTARLAERTDLIASGRGVAIGEQYRQREESLMDAGGGRAGITAVRKMYPAACNIALETPMNIVLIVSDTLRWDHLGASGNHWIRTPAAALRRPVRSRLLGRAARPSTVRPLRRDRRHRGGATNEHVGDA